MPRYSMPWSAVKARAFVKTEGTEGSDCDARSSEISEADCPRENDESLSNHIGYLVHRRVDDDDCSFVRHVLVRSSEAVGATSFVSAVAEIFPTHGA